MIDDMEKAQEAPPGQCSELQGIMQAVAGACASQVAGGGMGPLKQRQYLDTEPFYISRQLQRSFDFYRQV